MKLSLSTGLSVAGFFAWSGDRSGGSVGGSGIPICCANELDVDGSGSASGSVASFSAICKSLNLVGLSANNDTPYLAASSFFRAPVSFSTGFATGAFGVDVFIVHAAAAADNSSMAFETNVVGASFFLTYCTAYDVDGCGVELSDV